MKLFIIAGEPSGDRLGAALIKGFNTLSPNPADLIGIGGAHMADLGFESLFPIEDISIMRTIPNMTVIETGDATEVESICEVADKVDGPVYCRMLRGSVPRLFDTPLKLSDIRVLNSGTDILLITSGICTEEALRARAALVNAGISILHLQDAIPWA